MSLHDPLAGAVVGVPEDYDPAKCSTGGVRKRVMRDAFVLGAQHRTYMRRKRSQDTSKF